MPEIKVIISFIAISLTVIGYIPYLKDTFKGKTKPHVYTWFIWGLVTAIAFGLQVSAGAGAGAWVTLAVALTAFLIFFLALRNGNKNIKTLDTSLFVLSLVSLFLWLIVKQPILSIILVSLIDMLGFAPTVRKSWHEPYSETLFTYELNAIRHSLGLLALQHFNIVTWLYPGTWIIANVLFSIMLIIRRKQFRKNTQKLTSVDKKQTPVSLD